MECKCGSSTFLAEQNYRMEVIVDGEGNYINHNFGKTEDFDSGVVSVEPPEGPFTCTECGRTYDSLG